MFGRIPSIIKTNKTRTNTDYITNRKDTHRDPDKPTNK